ncbi:DUF1269 domain-containing protein [Streptomyces sp. NBC_00576]|uniref:DUF1269 domain-containing protein n=1 Tax=Streptomyces sp. NBC_00576 TaxID=2903665 RepID=UPI002E801436|nr:DUF1269 domain-containing protein [Streptomyces sp. NBC_00576]WUB74933.1 DUF1269 domain-containing protein [Streptomyces sp. NBC_00576]
MTDMIAVAYRDETTARQVLAELHSLNTEHSLHLADSVLVTRDEEGKVEIHSSGNPVVSGAVSGAVWGGLIGLLFLQPLLGAAIGAATGGVTASITESDDDNAAFIAQLGQRLQPGGAAVVALVIDATEEKVLPRIAGFGGDLLHASLTLAEEQRLRSAINPRPHPAEWPAA